VQPPKLHPYRGPSDLSQSINEGPKQPRLKLFPRSEFGAEKNKRMRSFNSDWYNIHPWVEYSALIDAAFCFPCRWFCVHVNEHNKYFIENGFKNWKKATEKSAGLKQHEHSEDHLTSSVKWESFKKLQVPVSENASTSSSVAAQLNESHRRLVMENRRYLQTLARVLFLTATQGIAQRGHNEGEESLNRGNFLEILSLIAEYNEEIRKKIESQPRNAKYTSPEVQNEIIQIGANLVLEQISTELQKSLCFAIMVDESKDITKREQLSIVVRYYFEGTIYERFLGFQVAKKLDAESLMLYIKSKLNKCLVDVKRCVAQTYDGASVMSGHLKGVQKLFRDSLSKQALYTHCFNHRLNLVLTDVCKNTANGLEFFSLLESLYVFLSGSAVHALFEDTQKLVCPKNKAITIKQICYTRWSAQVAACLAVKRLLPIILVFLHKLISIKHDRMSEAKGFLTQINFKFIFNLYMFNKFLSEFKIVSDYSQSITAEIPQLLNLIKSLKENMENYRRNDLFFDNLYKVCVALCVECDIDLPDKELTQPRRRKIPKKLENFVTECISLESEEPSAQNDFKSSILIPMLDKIISELNDRFSNNDSILRSTECFSPKSENFLSFSLLKPFAEHYNADLEQLENEFKLLPSTIKAYEKEKNIKVKSVMMFLDFLEIYKNAFQNSYYLCIVCITIPVSSAGCERTFSSMRYIKSYLRNSMVDERLSNLSVLFIEKKLTKTLSLETVVERFAELHKNRRLILY
jgi:hypothetical protein